MTKQSIEKWIAFSHRRIAMTKKFVTYVQVIRIYIHRNNLFFFEYNDNNIWNGEKFVYFRCRGLIPTGYIFYADQVNI